MITYICNTLISDATHVVKYLDSFLFYFLKLREKENSWIFTIINMIH